MFGYSDLIVDPRNLVLMRDAGCPITADITHALQQPTGKSLEVHPAAFVLKLMLLSRRAKVVLSVLAVTAWQGSRAHRFGNKPRHAGLTSAGF